MNIEKSYHHFGFNTLSSQEELQDLCLTNQPLPAGSDRGQVIQNCFETYENLINTLAQLKLENQFSYQTLNILGCQAIDSYCSITDNEFAADIKGEMHICYLIFHYIQYWFIQPMKRQDYLLGQDLFNYFKNSYVGKDHPQSIIEKILYNLAIGDIEEVSSLTRNIFPLYQQNLVLTHKFIYPQGFDESIDQIGRQREAFQQKLYNKVDNLIDQNDKTIVSIFCGNLDELANNTTNWKVFLLCYLMLVKFTAKPIDIAQTLIKYKQKFILADTLDQFLFRLFTTTSQLESIKLISLQSQYTWVAYLSLRVLECFRIDEVDQEKIQIFESKIREEVIKTFCNNGVHYESLFLVVIEEFQYRKFDFSTVSEILRKKAFQQVDSKNPLLSIFQRYQLAIKYEHSLNLSYWILHDFISEIFQERNFEIANTDLAGQALSFMLQYLQQEMPNQTIKQIFTNQKNKNPIQPLLNAYKIFLDGVIQELGEPIERTQGYFFFLKNVLLVCRSLKRFMEVQDSLKETVKNSHFNYLLKLIQLKFSPQNIDHSLMLEELIYDIKWPHLELLYSDIEAIIKFTGLNLILQNDYLINCIADEDQRQEIINNLCRCQLQIKSFCQFEENSSEQVQDLQKRIVEFIKRLKKN